MMKAGFVLAAFGAAMLAACGGGGSGGSPAVGAKATVSGTAATGKPLAKGQPVKASCAGQDYPTPVGNSGAFSVQVPQASLPCSMAAQTTLASVGMLHSETFAAGNVNVTPLTDLAVAVAQGANSAAPTQAQLNNAVQTLKQALTAAGFVPGIPDGVDIFTTPFTPDGTGIDGLIDDLMAAFRSPSTGKGYGATIADLKKGLPLVLPHKLTSSAGTSGGTGTGDGGVPGGTSPQGTCTAAGLEGDNPLLAAASPLTNALCPNASKAASFDPQACFTEAANPGTFTNFDPTSISGVGSLASSFSSCDPSGDPMSCLTALTGSLQSIPGLLADLPAQFSSAIPGGLTSGSNICNVGGSSGLPFDPTQLANQLQNLGGLADAAKQVPGLGALFGQIAGGGGGVGGLPVDPAQLQQIAGQLQNGDFSGLTTQAQAVLNQIPTLGPAVGQLLGTIAGAASACQSQPGPDCLSGVSDQLESFAEVLQQVPGLGDAIAAITSGGVPGLPSGGTGSVPGLDQLQSALANVPGLGDALNQGLAALAGVTNGDTPDPATILALFQNGASQLQNIPGLGTFIGALSSAASGGNPLEGLPGVPSGSTLPTLQQIPGVSELIAAFSGGTGTLSLAQLEQIPGLGALITAAQSAGGGSLPGTSQLPTLSGLDPLLALFQGLPLLSSTGG
ncbi:MAG: hypothetical protein EPN72_05115 [Nevskiaceae bacterium]|nr:MAG: hypothetical protein EPN63_04080 [Nevskiaceae bacterium]TBR73523.1 MAG: hypothetical protein EPN72_05115 [Nevskiaceae bacterium]